MLFIYYSCYYYCFSILILNVFIRFHFFYVLNWFWNTQTSEVKHKIQEKNRERQLFFSSSVQPLSPKVYLQPKHIFNPHQSSGSDVGGIGGGGVWYLDPTLNLRLAFFCWWIVIVFPCLLYKYPPGQLSSHSNILSSVVSPSRSQESPPFVPADLDLGLYRPFSTRKLASTFLPTELNI